MPTASVAAQAYASLARLTDAGSLAKAGSDTAAGGGFASLLKDALVGVKETGHKADVQAQSMCATR
jgi:flagellar hook-basal body complex protein FliE